MENVKIISGLNLRNNKANPVGETAEAKRVRLAKEKQINEAKKRVTEINKAKIKDNVELSNYLNINRTPKETTKKITKVENKKVVSEPMSEEAVAKGKQMSKTLKDQFDKNKSKSLSINEMDELKKSIKSRKTKDELENEALVDKYVVNPSATTEEASNELDKNVKEAVHNNTFGVKTGKQLDTIVDDSKPQTVKQEEKTEPIDKVKDEAKKKTEPTDKVKDESKEKTETKEDIKAKIAKEVKEQNYLKIPDKEAPKMSMKEDIVEKIVNNKLDKEEAKKPTKKTRINPALLAEQERLKGSEDEAGGGVFTSNTEDKEK